MKRTMLALTLIALLSSTTLAGSPDDADLRIPSPTRSSSSQGNTVSTPGNANPTAQAGVFQYGNDNPAQPLVGNPVWYAILGLLGLGVNLSPAG